jgi:hypothetical protein
MMQVKLEIACFLFLYAMLVANQTHVPSGSWRKTPGINLFKYLKLKRYGNPPIESCSIQLESNWISGLATVDVALIYFREHHIR